MRQVPSGSAPHQRCGRCLRALHPAGKCGRRLRALRPLGSAVGASARRWPATTRPAAEPAWHRRQRAKRGQDRLLLRLWKAQHRLSQHHSAQMPRGKGKNAGHNHVLAAIADAIHASTTYKGAGKGGKASKPDGAKGWVQDGRNCPNCDDFNFGFRLVCRQCGTRLPPARAAANDTNGAKSFKGAGKGNGSNGAWSAGKGAASDSATGTSSSTGPASPPAAAKPNRAEDDDPLDPAERVREIRTEEEKLRRTRGQYVENNPRMLAVIDEELEKLASEREKLQPLEVNLQAAAGRTAHARAALSKAKEKRTQAASELRSYMEKYKLADKEVTDAEAKLASAEAAATAKRTEIKLAGVDDAVELLRQAATDHCGDAAVATQVAAALQQIAGLLGAITGAPQPAETAGDAKPGAACPRDRNTTGKAAGAAVQSGAQQEIHAVFTACGATDAKSRRIGGPPSQQCPAAHAAPPGVGDDNGGHADGAEVYAGGAVEGEVPMGGDGQADEADLLSQAAAVLGDGADEL